MKKIIVLCLLSFILNFLSFGKVKLPSVISNNMVLQQNSMVKIWGWAKPEEKISIQTGWDKKKYQTITDEKGNWLVKVKTAKAGGPYTIMIVGEDQVILENVMLGEVWICSGQSNMEFTTKMLGGWDNYKNEKADFEKYDLSNIRLCQIDRVASPVPVDTCNAKWFNADPATSESFSAVAFYYGKELYKKLKVPIGLISSNWGGTPAEAWTEKSYMENDSDLSYYVTTMKETDWKAGKPSYLFNSMVNPLVNFSIRGAIWYQGESNVPNANLYKKLFSAMIKCWRDKWQLGNFPFYYVQIAPFDYGDDIPASAYLREQQFQTLSVPNTGMAVTMDIGNKDDIHPKNKPEVGRRLALLALAKTYKKNVPAFSGPVYKSMKIENDKIRLFFDYADDGLFAKGNKLTGFKIADSKMQFVDAEASIEKNTVIVSSSQIKNPTAVRFAFTNTDSSNLYNKAWLPSTSFRTDTTKFYIMNVFRDFQFEKEKSQFNLSLFTKDGGAEIVYTLDGSEPTLFSTKYKNPIPLSNSYVICAKALKGGLLSLSTMKLEYARHFASFCKANYKFSYSEKFAAANEYALTDGLLGTKNYQDGHWQGFLQDDLDAVIELKETKTIKKISIGFLRNNKMGIFLPALVEYSLSEDGLKFSEPAVMWKGKTEDDNSILIKTVSADVKSAKARFVKIHASNIGIYPDWHPKKNDKAWLFADELRVE